VMSEDDDVRAPAIEDLADLSPQSGPRAPRTHTQHFDRVAFYGSTAAARIDSRTQAFLKSPKAQLMVHYLYTVNFLFAALAVSIAVVGVTVGQRHSQRLVGVVSDAFARAILGFAVALLGFALLGFCAARTRNRCLLLAYFVSVVVLLVALIALMLTQALVTRSDTLQAMVRHLWESAVADDPLEVCDLQHDLRCSGFSATCQGFVAVRPDCANCTDAGDTEFPQACWLLLQRLISDNLRPITYVSVATLAAAALALLAALGLFQRLRIPESERMLYSSIASEDP